MALTNYHIKSASNRWSASASTEQWELVYSIPNTVVQSETENFRVSLKNLLPGCDETNLYAPCIHASRVSDDPDDKASQLVTVLYQAPSDDMILQPGRGLLNFATYSTTKQEETAVFRDGREIARQELGLSSDAQFASWTSTLERRTTLLVLERGLMITRLADWATYELDIYVRANAWIGMGGEFTINGKKFDNLKLSRVDIQRKPSDASVVLSTWQFARNPDGWGTSGIVQDEWYATDFDGNEVEYDPDATPPVVPSGSFMSIKLSNTDSEVVRGFTDFTPVEQYFRWMKR